MAVDYDLACRRDALGPLLTAAILARKGCRVLVLPAADEVRPDPGFLVPVVRGYPAELLAALVGHEDLPGKVLSWSAVGDGKKPDWEGFSRLVAAPGDSPAGLERLWRLIDDCMRLNLEMPVASLGGTGRILWLVVRNQLLRENRSRRLSHWLEAREINADERVSWRSLVPLLTLSRFADPPLLAYAYGAAVLARPGGWLRIFRLKTRLLEILRRCGAEFTEEDLRPVFDGKWYIGVGRNRQAARRSTVFLADSDPRTLRREVASGDQRLDFKRQMELAEPGFVVYKEEIAEEVAGGFAPYHLECGDSRDFTGASLVVSGEARNGRPVRYRFRPAGPKSDWSTLSGAGYWGWGPRLPAMMGGVFLPLARGFCRFYQVGWHNLPGFGYGGLVYSARQAAVRVWTHDLRKESAKLDE